MSQPDLEEVLSCCALMEFCRAADRNGTSNFDLGAILGELDWHKELCRLLEEWKMETRKQDPYEVPSLDSSTGADEFGTPHNQNEFPMKENDPNSRQVGGGHYKGGAWQHWDWSLENHLGGLEYAATKYLVRWKDKGGIADVEKAGHYVDKLIDWYGNKKAPLPRPRAAVKVLELAEVYNLSVHASNCCMMLCLYVSVEMLIQVRKDIDTIIWAEKKNREYIDKVIQERGR